MEDFIFFLVWLIFLYFLAWLAWNFLKFIFTKIIWISTVLQYLFLLAGLVLLLLAQMSDFESWVVGSGAVVFLVLTFLCNVYREKKRRSKTDGTEKSPGQTPPSQSEPQPLQLPVPSGQPSSSVPIQIPNFEGLKGEEFENLVAKLFEHEGCRVSKTPRSNDGGIDLILERPGQKKKKDIVQCKNWKNKIGVEAVRALYGVLKGETCYEKAFFVVSSNFTNEAWKFASGKTDLTLINGKRLRRWIRNIQQDCKVPDFLDRG